MAERLYLDDNGLRTLVEAITSFVEAKVGNAGNDVVFNTTGEFAKETSASVANRIYAHVDGTKVRVKIGDGKTAVPSLLFVDNELYDHVADANVHVTTKDKTSWNNKVTAYIDATVADMIVFSKE